MSVEVALESAHGSHMHASMTFDDISADWQQYRATLTANASDTTARLAVRLQVILPSWLLVQPCTFSAALHLLKRLRPVICSCQPVVHLCAWSLGSARAWSRV